MSEALILESVYPQYENRLFIELQVQYKKIASSEHIVYTNWFFFDIQNNFCTQHVLNLQFSCTEQFVIVMSGLIASEKDLPVVVE